VQNLIILISLSLFSGCATIIHGTKQNIYVTSEPSGAKIIYQGKELGETPKSIKISRDENAIIIIKKYGYYPEQETLSSSDKNWISSCLLPWGILISAALYHPLSDLICKMGPLASLSLTLGPPFVGPLIDIFSGAFFKLPSAVSVTLKETDSVRFEYAKRTNTIEAYEKFLEHATETYYLTHARKILDTLYYRQAQEVNTAEIYRKYLRKFPKGLFKSEVESKLKQLDPGCFSLTDTTDIVSIDGQLKLIEARAQYYDYSHITVEPSSNIRLVGSNIRLLGIVAEYWNRITHEFYTLWIRKGEKIGTLRRGKFSGRLKIIGLSFSGRDGQVFEEFVTADLEGSCIVCDKIIDDVEPGIVSLNEVQLVSVLKKAGVSLEEWRHSDWR